MSTLSPALAALLAFLMALGLLDQWRERRRTYQLAWAIGSILFGIASTCEAIGAANGWSGPVFLAWYLAGAVLNVGWLGLGTAFLLAKTRFGYTYALLLAMAGLITVATQSKNHYPDVGAIAFVYLGISLILAVAVGVETWFQNERWPRIAALGVIGATILGAGLVVQTQLPAGPLALDAHGIPVLDALPGTLRLLTPFMNVTGGLTLFIGALFSAYVFMPKRRVLGYSLDPGQGGEQLLFNLLIAPFAIIVNFAASLPGAFKALLLGRLHSRVPATLLIAIGAALVSGTDFGVKGGSTDVFALSKLLGIALIFAGFLLSTEAFRELRIPFTKIRFGRSRSEVPGTPPG